MKARRIILISLLLASAYVAFVGCGDEETTNPPSNTDAGNDRTTPPPPPPQDSSTGDARLDSGSPEFTGSHCSVAADCYGGLDAAALKGEPVCIDKATDGYCTHKCQTDQDCCAIPGECVTGLKQVCSSFENSPDKYCFLSCEEADINSASDGGFTDAGVLDGGGINATLYCETNANPEFACRSSGGGSANRKVCFPNGGGDGGPGNDAGDGGDASDASDAADAADADGG